MKKSVSFALLYVAIVVTGATPSSHAQTSVPTFEAEHLTHWDQDQSEQAAAQVSSTSHQALTEVLESYDLYELDAEAISNYVQSSSGPASFQLALDEEHTWSLTLEENNLLAPDYESFALTPEGEVATLKPATVTFRGQLNAEGGGEVRLLLDGDQMKGFITYRGKKMYLENLSGLTSEADDSQFVFYAEDDVQEDGSLMCLAKEEKTYQQNVDGRVNERVAAACENQAELEIATLALFSRYQAAGSSESATNNEILGILNNVQSNYTQFGIAFRVVEQVVSTSSSSDPWSTTVPRDILGEFTEWGPTGFQNQHDAGICFYQKDRSGPSTVGVAWVGAICTDNRYSVCDRLSTSESNRVLVAHEMGHNFDASHDGEGAPFIMAPSVNAATEWSSSSINSINNHIATRECLACVDGDDGDPLPPGPGDDEILVIRALGTTGEEQMALQIDGQTVDTWSVTQEWAEYTYEGPIAGSIRVAFTNDAITPQGEDRNLRVDYIQVQGAVIQAEGQADNTGAYVTTCGDGSNTEWIHCTGSIGFGGGSAIQAGNTADVTLSKEGFDRNLVRIFPNPSTHSFRLVAPSDTKQMQVRIFDVQGHVVESAKQVLPGQAIELGASLLPGIYTIHVEAGASHSSTKVIKQ